MMAAWFVKPEYKTHVQGSKVTTARWKVATGVVWQWWWSLLGRVYFMCIAVHMAYSLPKTKHRGLLEADVMATSSMTCTLPLT